MNPSPRNSFLQQVRRCEIRLPSGRVCNSSEDVRAVQFERPAEHGFDSASHLACRDCREGLKGQLHVS